VNSRPKSDTRNCIALILFLLFAPTNKALSQPASIVHGELVVMVAISDDRGLQATISSQTIQLDPSVLNPLLLRAAAIGHVATAQVLLRAGANVNAAGENGWTPVLVALVNGHATMATALLDAGARADTVGPNGVGALDLARALDDTQLIQRLRRARPANERLLEAAQAGDLAEVRAAITGGASTEARTPNGWSALMLAAQSGRLEVVRALTSAGVSANTITQDGASALHLAVLGGHGEVVRHLLGANVPVDLRAPGGARPLVLAIAVRDEAMANLLLERGASRNALEGEAVSPGQLASFAGLTGLVTRLGGAGGSPLPAVAVGAQLMEAIATGAATRVTELLAAGANPLLPLPNGLTPLHWAVASNQPAVFRAMVLSPQLRELPPDRLLQGNNPLQGAARGNILHTAARVPVGVGIISDLSRLGSRAQLEALMNERDANGRTPLLVSIMVDGEFARFALSTLPVSQEALRRADNQGFTPLEAAVIQGRHEVVRALLRAGAPAVSSQGRPALRDIARARGDMPMLSILPTPPDQAPTRALSREEVAEAQGLLRRFGFFAGQPNGQMTDQTSRAFEAAAVAMLVPNQRDLNLGALDRLRDLERTFSPIVARPDQSPRGTRNQTTQGATARFNRGMGFERGGPNTPVDLAEAAHWYGLAAGDGDVRAMVQLGLLLMRGQGVTRDPLAASVLWRIAAARGDATAAFNLGAMLEQGIGVARNQGWARFWYDLAAQQGHAQAREGLQRVGATR
jgi:uncharacterized protein